MTIRIGIVGAGLWTERAHLPAFTHLPGVTVAGIADPDVERARALASRVRRRPRRPRPPGAPRSRPRRARRSWRPTTCTTRWPRPPSTPGLPVLCEKPLARTVPEAADLVARAAAAGVATKLGFVFRYSPALRQLRALVQRRLRGPRAQPRGLQPEPPVHGPGRPVPLEDGRGPDGRRRRRRVRLAQPGPRPVDRRRDRRRCAPTPGRSCRSVRIRSEAGDGASTWTTCARGWARRRAASRACSTRAGRRSVSRGVTSRSSATAAPSSGGAGTTPGPSPSCSGRRRPPPRSRRWRSPVDLTAGLEWATTWRECFMGNLARAFVAEVGGRAGRGPDVRRRLSRPARPRRDRDVARRAALGRGVRPRSARAAERDGGSPVGLPPPWRTSPSGRSRRRTARSSCSRRTPGP